MAYSNVNPVFHGLGYSYGSGSSPSVAVNRHATALEVHKNEYGIDLYYKVGWVNRATIQWEDSQRYDVGATPQVALNNHNVAVEVHKNQLTGYTLFYRVGDVSERAVDWGPSERISHGRTPSVALNDNGIVVEMHKAEYWNELWYNLFRVQGRKLIRLGGGRLPGKGVTPKVALNAGMAVEVHRDNSSNRLYYRSGRVFANHVDFSPAHLFGTGADPSVALLDDRTVIVTFERGKELFRRVGKVAAGGRSIQWDADPIHYDDGMYSSVAATPGMSVEVHEGKTLKSLWFSNSLITNRATWMSDRLATLGDKPLRNLVLPASHDAGMYGRGTFEQLGKTQSLSLWGQLTAGVRYFDLRPRWKQSSRRFVMYHGPVDGPPLSEVLADISRFAGEKDRRELMILKFSHFESDIDDNKYKLLVDQISASLDKWLVKSAPKGKRLAEMTLNEYLANGQTAILVVVDGDHPVNRRTPGFWVYRDWHSRTPAVGDFRVFDVWSNDHRFEVMKDEQFDHFALYDGLMQHDRSLVCDLFLLSWTLTAPTYVWWFSMEANRRLGRYIHQLSRPNYYRQIPNLLYVDYVEFARVTDVAILENERPLHASEKAKRPKGVAKKRRLVAE